MKKILCLFVLSCFSIGAVIASDTDFVNDFKQSLKEYFYKEYDLEIKDEKLSDSVEFVYETQKEYKRLMPGIKPYLSALCNKMQAYTKSLNFDFIIPGFNFNFSEFNCNADGYMLYSGVFLAATEIKKYQKKDLGDFYFKLYSLLGQMECRDYSFGIPSLDCDYERGVCVASYRRVGVGNYGTSICCTIDAKKIVEDFDKYYVENLKGDGFEMHNNALYISADDKAENRKLIALNPSGHFIPKKRINYNEMAYKASEFDDNCNLISEQGVGADVGNTTGDDNTNVVPENQSASNVQNLPVSQPEPVAQPVQPDENTEKRLDGHRIKVFFGKIKRPFVQVEGR